MDHILGIDPSERNTGLALYERGAGVVFTEIAPKEVDVLSAVLHLQRDLREYCAKRGIGPHTLVSIEKMVLSGHSSTLLFYVQMAVLEVLAERGITHMLHPLPIQLHSFIKKFEKGSIGSKTEIVASFREKYGKKLGTKRLSSHCVDAFYLLRLAQEVCRGSWEYNLPSKEVRLFPWTLVNKGPFEFETSTPLP